MITHCQGTKGRRNAGTKFRARGWWTISRLPVAAAWVVVSLWAPHAFAGEVISRAWTVRNRHQPPPAAIVEAHSQGQSVRNRYQPPPPNFVEMISRASTSCNLTGSVDEDGDGFHDCLDLCPGDDNLDTDGDTVANGCDPCPTDPNPVFSLHPADTDACEGEDALLTASATPGSGGPVTYQWRKAGVNLAGQTASSLSLADVSMAEVGSYDVAATNACGTHYSNPAVLTLIEGDLAFPLQPAPLTTAICTTAVFTADVSSALPVTLRWHRDGQPLSDGPTGHDSVISGATTETLQIEDAHPQDDGIYELVATNDCGEAVSDPAELIIDAPVGWAALGNGIWGSRVLALAAYNDQLIAGGFFPSAGGIPVSSIASWNGAIWMPLGGGIIQPHPPLLPTYPGFVHALVVYQGDLIAGGSFELAGGISANNIARWNGTNWSSLGGGVSARGPVLALTVFNGELIVGGFFTTVDGVAVANIARWDGATWQPLGAGVNGGVRCLAVYDGDLIAAGFFTHAGGQPVNYIARWDGLDWSSLDGGLTGRAWSYANGTCCYQAGASVMALTVHGDNLVAAGQFGAAGGHAVSDVASWDGNTWSRMGTAWQYNHYSAVTSFDSELFIGGDKATYLNRWNGTNWESVNGGTNGAVLAFSQYDEELIAGGIFRAAGGVSGLNQVARLTYIAADDDRDGVCNEIDNCVTVANLDQADSDSDGIGDVCDFCPGGDDAMDVDEDGVPDACDNCPTIYNPGTFAIVGGMGGWSQPDTDADGVGDACDNCPTQANADQVDADLDNIGDACDTFVDTDGDGLADHLDLEPNVPSTLFSYTAAGNPPLTGEVVDVPEGVSVQISGETRPCPQGTCSYLVISVTDGALLRGISPPPILLKVAWLHPQISLSAGLFSLHSGLAEVQCMNGEARLEYDFGDEFVHELRVPFGAAAHIHENRDVNDDVLGILVRGFNEIVLLDGVIVAPGQFFELGVAPAVDTDGDTVPDTQDNCILAANLDQADDDLDLIGDACDNCPGVFNQFQNDKDADGIGDVCDACPLDATNDSDGDAVCAPDDNCVTADNPLQEDSDEDGIGDACEPLALAADPGGASACRFISFVVPPPPDGQSATALRVRLISLHHPNDPPPGTPDFSALEGELRYVNLLPGGSLDCPDSVSHGTSFHCARLGCEPEYRDWAAELTPEPGQPQVSGLLFVTGNAIAPSSIFHIGHLAESCGPAATAADCPAASPELAVVTSLWGDVAASGGAPPDGLANVIDIGLVVDKVKELATALPERRCWLKLQVPEPQSASINVIDIGLVVDAVKGFPYPYTIAACP